MFEYTAMVDAPVKRFTSIVTDPDPDETQVTVVVAAPIARVVVPVPEAPVLIVAVEPEPAVAFEPEPEATPPPVEAPAEPMPAPRVDRTFVPRAEPAATSPSIVPALIGIAAAGITALWWMRRDSHDRR